MSETPRSSASDICPSASKASSIGYTTRDEIFVRGRSLTKELMGKLDFVDMILLQITGKVPTPNLRAITNAILVAVSDHGITPSVIAARMTLLGAPEALQGAVAAGLLGAGDHFLGTTQKAAELLTRSLTGRESWHEDDLRNEAERIVADAVGTKRALPGFGHPIHTEGDPRTERLFEIARETGFDGRHSNLLRAIHAALIRQRGKFIPLNVAGAIGAVVSDMGFKPVMSRAFSLIARTPGLVAHLAEEIDRPMADATWKLILRESGGFGEAVTRDHESQTVTPESTS